MARKKSKTDARTINLRSGGTVMVELGCSAFDLTKADRDFVNRLVEMLQSYDAKASPASSAAVKKKGKARPRRGVSGGDAEPAAVAT